MSSDTVPADIVRKFVLAYEASRGKDTGDLALHVARRDEAFAKMKAALPPVACPFCEVECTPTPFLLKDAYHVRCPGCSSFGPPAQDVKSALIKWNRRRVT